MGICEDLPDFERRFMRLWERICKTLGEDSWGFARISETLGEDSQGLQGFLRLWERVHEDSQDFGRGFAGIARIRETLREDL